MEEMNTNTATEMDEIHAVLNDICEGTPTDTVKGVATMELHAHLRGTNLFIPGVRDPRNLDAVLGALGLGPIWLALSGGGKFLMGGHEVSVPAVNLRDISFVHCSLTLDEGMFSSDRFVCVGLGLTDKDAIKAARLTVRQNEVKVEGVAMRLEPWMVRLQSASEATLTGVKYNWPSFFKSYRSDLAGAMKEIVEERVLTTPRIGLQAHAAYDPRVGENEVGVSLHDYRRLTTMSGKTGLNGKKVLLGRYPASPKTGFRPVTLVVLEDQSDGAIYLNAESWRDLHGGDFDGDLAYILMDEDILAGDTDGDLDMMPKYPTLRITNSDGVKAELVNSLSPMDEDRAVSLVMGMLIKKLTGSLTMVFHVLARSAAVNYVKNPSYPGTEKERMRKAYEGVFTVFHPVLEAVMDARKETGKEAALRLVAQTLQNVMNGGVIAPEVFNIFLNND